jgi:hypothetical protein
MTEAIKKSENKHEMEKIAREAVEAIIKKNVSEKKSEFNIEQLCIIIRSSLKVKALNTDFTVQSL